MTFATSFTTRLTVFALSIFAGGALALLAGLALGALDYGIGG